MERAEVRISTQSGFQTSQSFVSNKNGRDDWIRTSDPLHPMQVHYQAVLRPDAAAVIYRKGLVVMNLMGTASFISVPREKAVRVRLIAGKPKKQFS